MISEAYRCLEVHRLTEDGILRPLVEYPGERLAVEYKDWLDVKTNHGKATLAKHVIALANHGGGHIVLGFAEHGDTLVSRPRPPDLSDITQDAVNEAVRRYVEPEFHCEMRVIVRTDTSVAHPVIGVPGGFPTPVMSRRDCEGVIRQYGCYIRKPGPRSEEPHSYGEWESLLDRCVRNTRAEMLDSIRDIVTGRVEPEDPVQSATDHLRQYCIDARSRWAELTSDLEDDDPATFLLGYHEIGLSLLGSEPAGGFNEIRRRLDEARSATSFSGWPLFLHSDSGAYQQLIHDDFIEVWVGRPLPIRWDDSPFFLGFWRASVCGDLYSINGYFEDGVPQHAIPGQCFDISTSAQQVGEGLIFARRLAELFEDVDRIAIRCRFTGLNDRSLVALRGRLVRRWVCRTDAVEFERQVTVQQVDNNLAEVVHSLLLPVYEHFDFYELPFETVQRALQDMRR